MAKFDFDKPVASFSWYLKNGSTDDKRGNRLHVGTGQKAQIYFDPESGEFIGKLKYVDDYIDLADGAKQHFELPRTAREYKPSDFSPKFPISNVKFEVDESVKDFIHVLPRGLFFYQNEFYDAVFGDKTDYPESLKDFLFTRTGDIEAAGEFYGAIEKWPQSVYGTLVEMSTPVTLSDKRYMTSISKMPISTVRFTVTSETGRLLFYVELSIDLPRPARMGSNFIASIHYRPATMKNCSTP